jgi:hypothetical protein
VWLGLGLLLAIASLAKPHAFFLVPAVVIFIMVAARGTKAAPLVPSLARVSAFSSSLFVGKFAFGYLLAGEKALSVFGTYGGAISSGEAVSRTLGIDTWQNLPETAFGQLLMLTIVLGLSIPVALVGLWDSISKKSEYFLANKFRALFALALLNMAAVSALFEAWQGLNTWMHTRYYSYLIPLAVIALLEGYKHSGLVSRRVPKLATIGLFLLLSTYSILTAAVPYGGNWIDAPDFRAHIDNLVPSSMAIVLGIGLVIWWKWNTKTSIVTAIGVSILAAVLAGTHISGLLVNNYGQDNVHDELGRFLRNNLPGSELDRTILMGSDPTVMQRALFLTLSGKATYRAVTGQEPVRDEFLEDYQWLVVMNDIELEGLPAPVIHGPAYKLYGLKNQSETLVRNSSFSQFTNPCFDEGPTGWVCGQETVVELKEAAPKNASIDLVFEVSKEAAQLELEFELGGSVFRKQFIEGANSITIRFLNPVAESKFRISYASDSSHPRDTSLPLVKLVSLNLVSD